MAQVQRRLCEHLNEQAERTNTELKSGRRPGVMVVQFPVGRIVTPGEPQEPRH